MSPVTASIPTGKLEFQLKFSLSSLHNATVTWFTNIVYFFFLTMSFCCSLVLHKYVKCMY